MPFPAEDRGRECLWAFPVPSYSSPTTSISTRNSGQASPSISERARNRDVVIAVVEGTRDSRPTRLGCECSRAAPVTAEKGLPVPRDGLAMDSNQAMERASHPKPGVLSDFILGSQDGIVNVLGIILGLSAATRDVRIILVATLAALGAESIAMGAVAYTSTRARRRLYLSQVVQERREMEEVPQTERDEVRNILAGWGYKDADLEEIVERICRNPTAELEFMMSFELKLSPVEVGAPRASAFLVGTATVVGHFIPLSPFFFVGSDVLLGAVLAILLSGVALFGIGWYEAKITVGSWWREGLEMLVIGLAGGVAGYVIGRLVGAA